jgi:hypothetical protein
VKSQPGSNRKSGRKEDITQTIGIPGGFPTVIKGKNSTSGALLPYQNAIGKSPISNGSPLVKAQFNERKFACNATDLPSDLRPRQSIANAN